MSADITIEDIDYHRNGVTGQGFYVVIFTDNEANPQAPRRRIATVFDASVMRRGKEIFRPDPSLPFHNCQVAVLDLETKAVLTFVSAATTTQPSCTRPSKSGPPSGWSG